MDSASSRGGRTSRALSTPNPIGEDTVAEFQKSIDSWKLKGSSSLSSSRKSSFAMFAAGGPSRAASNCSDLSSRCSSPTSSLQGPSSKALKSYISTRFFVDPITVDIDEYPLYNQDNYLITQCPKKFYEKVRPRLFHCNIPQWLLTMFKFFDQKRLITTESFHYV